MERPQGTSEFHILSRRNSLKRPHYLLADDFIILQFEQGWQLQELASGLDVSSGNFARFPFTFIFAAGGIAFGS